MISVYYQYCLVLLLQELEHGNASLSAQLSKQLAIKNSETEALSYKLGAAEYELVKLSTIVQKAWRS